MADETQTQTQAPTQTLKWYKQTAVWAIIISVVAIVLSQLPQIKTWIPKETLKAEVSERIKLVNEIGRPGYAFQVDLKNTGNRDLTISNFVVAITYPSGKEKMSKAQGYTKNAGGHSQDFPFLSSEIKVGERWSEWVLFYSPLSPTEDEESGRVRAKVNESFQAKIKAMPANQYNPNYPIELNSEVVSEAVGLFNRRFETEKGTYKVSVKCDINGRTTLVKQFNFTLYDNHIFTFKSQTEGYKYGYGLVGPVEPNKEVWATISESN